MTVRYTPRATADLVAIGEYIRDRSPSAAIKVEQAIGATIELLEDFPGLGREREELGVRALLVPKYRYAIYYRIEGDEVWIAHIRDGRRKPLQAGEV